MPTCATSSLRLLRFAAVVCCALAAACQQGAKQTLTVSRIGTGQGGVTSSPLGLNCGSQCTAQFAPGTSITLTASPAFGSTFGG